MPMRNQTRVPERRTGIGTSERDYTATIVPLKTTPDHERAELIRAVVDAYGRLQDSVRRFLLMLADALADVRPGEALASASFDDLLTLLARHAKAVSFGRIVELTEAIDEARSAEARRNVVFSSAFSHDAAALRAAAAMLERLDAVFVGLCVDHVLKAHSRSALASAYPD
ncbi:hypothetical protein AWB81_01255 [Caballeronia arationis]|uniref:Uncharacterized protein n=2 Tax=Caballeronia arationis TaxID=1777142 RepID=A0A7Z7I464_9BURK|nr:hypothetical protein AWB81_01255 [Caballeronia arationis]SOE61080.1 hypothetical protein SAMN05446927_2044 [Caballeronia arationis]